MTPDDILRATPDVDSDIPTMRDGTVVFPLFGQNTTLSVIGPNEDQVVTHEMAASLTELLAVTPDRMPELEAILSEDCTRMCEDMEYEFMDVEIAPGEDELEGCRLAFGMNRDGSFPPGLVSQWVSFIGLDIPNGAYMRLNPPWEEEHGVLIRLEDGKFTVFGLEYYGSHNTDAFRLPMPT